MVPTIATKRVMVKRFIRLLLPLTIDLRRPCDYAPNSIIRNLDLLLTRSYNFRHREPWSRRKWPPRDFRIRLPVTLPDNRVDTQKHTCPKYQPLNSYTSDLYHLLRCSHLFVDCSLGLRRRRRTLYPDR